MNWISPRVIRGNRGDIASRYGILQAFLDAGAAVSAVFAARPQHLPEPLRARMLPYGPLYNLWPRVRGLRALRQGGAIVWTGGLDLQDDSSLLKLVHTWLVFLSYRLMRLKLLIALQGAGPLTSPAGRWLARRVLAQADLVLARDRGSYALLAGLMNRRRLRLAADGIFLPGFQSDAPTSDAVRLNGAGRPVIGVNIRLWFHFAHSWIPFQFARDRYLARAEAPMNGLLAAMSAVIAHLRSRYDARVLLVSMYEPNSEPWEDDQPYLEQLKAGFADDSEVVLCNEDRSIDDVCRMFSRLDLMIGMRLHATLIALRVGVPAIHLAYTLKGGDIYADLGLDDWTLAIEDVIAQPASAIACVDRVMADANRRDRVSRIVAETVARNATTLTAAIRELE